MRLKFYRLSSKGFFDFLSWFCVKHNVNNGYFDLFGSIKLKEKKISCILGERRIQVARDMWYGGQKHYTAMSPTLTSSNTSIRLACVWWFLTVWQRSGFFPSSFLFHGLGMRIGQEKNKSILPFYCHFNYSPHFFDYLRSVFLLIFLLYFIPIN